MDTGGGRVPSIQQSNPGMKDPYIKKSLYIQNELNAINDTYFWVEDVSIYSLIQF